MSEGAADERESRKETFRCNREMPLVRDKAILVRDALGRKDAVQELVAESHHPSLGGP
ncbi:MAG: hypothetical protein OXL38_23285 [Gammaproteobacteria bacterium]|nr:hypothetical protein [Gammaproteobacteria bacterium]